MAFTLPGWFIFFSILVFFVFILYVSNLRLVRENTRLSIYRLGRYIGDKGPGMVFVIPFIDRAVVKELNGVDKTPSTQFTGVIGEARTTVYTNGKVFLMGEEWDAMSQSPISAGQRVRVVRMIVEVEKE
jgi:regulator of protease activity HflC (stomatin/prohibitin superfamily)